MKGFFLKNFEKKFFTLVSIDEKKKRQYYALRSTKFYSPTSNTHFWQKINKSVLIIEQTQFVNKIMQALAITTYECRYVLSFSLPPVSRFLSTFLLSFFSPTRSVKLWCGPSEMRGFVWLENSTKVRLFW